MPARSALLGLTALLALSGGVHADNRMRLIDEDNALYRATFDGGHLGEFIDMLREGVGDRVMFVTPDRASEISLPKFDVANVELGDVVALASQIANVRTYTVEQSNWSMEFALNTGVPIVVFDTAGVLTPRRASTRIEMLSFSGGSVTDYVSALKNAGGEGRVVITGDASNVPLGPISLRDASLMSAVFLLDGTEHTDGSLRTAIDVEELDGIYRVHVQSRDRSISTDSSVWSLRRITAEGMEPTTLLSAIEAGLETLDPGFQPRLKYHEPTALLIAVGPDEALMLIQAIIDGLTESAVVSANTMSNQDLMKQYEGMLRRHLDRLMQEHHMNKDRANTLNAQAMALLDAASSIVEETQADIIRRSQMLTERDWVIDEAETARVRSGRLEQEIERLHTRLGQLQQMIERVESGTEVAPSPSLLEQEFGINSTPSMR